MTEAALRRDASACLQAAVEAVDPRRLTAEALRYRPDLDSFRHLHVVAVGKAAAAMLAGALDALGPSLVGGVVIVPSDGEGEAPERFETYGGGHPIPNHDGQTGAEAIRREADELGEEDLLLCLISGGGSALMTLPPSDVSLADVQAVTEALLASGATINDLNCVRKHLDQLKGGRLARAAAPARVLALILSDVVGDRLDVIASGPVTPDPTTRDDAIGVLRRFGVWDRAPTSVREALRDGEESPKPGDPCFARVETRIVGNNRLAAQAALAKAGELGYQPLLLTTTLVGEARQVGQVLASIGVEARRQGQPVAPPACLVAAGETTVTLRGSGRGGRNQEVALGASAVLAGFPGVLVAAFGTDGIDGPTDAAGAMADGATIRRAAELGLEPSRALANNDAYTFFSGLDDLIVTGPTGTNVMDLVLIMVEGQSACEAANDPADIGDPSTTRETV